MIEIYTYKDTSLQVMDFNDSWFDSEVIGNIEITPEAAKLVEQIDGCTCGKHYDIYSKFTGNYVSMEYLSTGCKTALNCLFYPDMIFCIDECGENALTEIFKLPNAKLVTYFPLPILSNNIKNKFRLHQFNKDYKDYADYFTLRGEVSEWE